MMDLTFKKPAAATSSVSRETTADRFENDVLRVSLQKPVVVEFWAPWCGPCRQLMPLLEKAIAASSDAVDMVKVNIDDSPELAQIFRVQSVPMVYAFFQGQPVDGFMGLKTESELKAFVDKLITLAGGPVTAPDAVDPEIQKKAARLIENAVAFFADDKTSEAMEAYSQALDLNADDMTALAGIGWCLLAEGDIDAVREMFGQITPEQQQSPAFKGLSFVLAAAPPGDDAAVLLARIEKNKKDHAARYDLAQLYLSQGRVSEAIDALIDLTRLDREWNDQKARALLVSVFDALGPAHAYTARGRRKLSAVLFS